MPRTTIRVTKAEKALEQKWMERLPPLQFSAASTRLIDHLPSAKRLREDRRRRREERKRNDAIYAREEARLKKQRDEYRRQREASRRESILVRTRGASDITRLSNAPPVNEERKERYLLSIRTIKYNSSEGDREAYQIALLRMIEHQLIILSELKQLKADKELLITRVEGLAHNTIKESINNLREDIEDSYDAIQAYYCALEGLAAADMGKRII